MIHGTSFFDSPALHCKYVHSLQFTSSYFYRVGTVLCEAHWFNSSVVSCLVPPAGHGQFVVPVSRKLIH